MTVNRKPRQVGCGDRRGLKQALSRCLLDKSGASKHVYKQDYGLFRRIILSGNPNLLNDREMLEVVLSAARYADRRAVALLLLRRFGSFSSAIEAPLVDLRAVEGLGEVGIAALKMVQAAARRLERAEDLYRPVLSDWDRLMAYLHTVLARERIEQFRILFLDTRNRLLADEVQARRTVNHTPVCPREVVKMSLQLHASKLILVDHRASGDLQPSESDITMTREVKAATRSVSVTLDDHIIIGDGSWLSFRLEGLL